MGYFYMKKPIACCAAPLLSAFLLILSVLGTALGITACASSGSGGQVSGDGAEISARGAIGRLEAVISGPMFEGEGGKDMRLAVLAPEAQGAAPEYLPVYVQGLLNNNFKKYGNVTLVDRQNLDKIIAEQNIAANGRFTDADFVSIGNLTNAQYFLIGTIQKLSGDQYSLQLSVSDSSTGERKAVFMKNGALRQIEGNGALINEASADLLAQLGVQLTAAGKQSLLAGNTSVVRAETGLAKGITAQASGASVEALFNYTQAINFDPSQLEALTRLDTLSTSISGGNISERIMYDFQARDRWIEVFKETARFFREHPPFEITFDPNLLQEGKPDYVKRTVNLAMRVALDPSEAGFAALNTLLDGLEKTGQRGEWGFKGWPLEDITPKTAGTVVFDGKKTFSFKLDVTLLNDSRKTLGKGSYTFSGTLPFAAGDRNVAAPKGTEGMVHFTSIKADDLTPILTIVISAVNGIPSATLNSSGYMRIDAQDMDKKNAVLFNNSAFAYFSKGDWDRAIADYNRAIQLDPSNTAYKDNLQAVVEAVQKAAADYNTRALAYYDKKDYDRAITDYNQAIWLDPSNAAYQNNLAAAQKAQAASYNTSGLAYYGKKDYDRAITDYNQAIRLDPSNAVYRDNLAAAEKGQADQIAAARKAEAASYNTSGLAYYGKKDYDRAITDYNQAIRLDHSNTMYKNNLAAAQKAQADQIAAARKAEAASYNTSGLAHFNKKEYDQAITDYYVAIQLDPSNTTYKNNLQAAQKAVAIAYHTSGADYLHNWELDRAIMDFSQEILLDPNNADAYLWRGIAYDMKDDDDRALADYNQTIRLDPNNVTAYRNRGMTYAAKGNYQQAIADYMQVLKLDPINNADVKRYLEEARKMVR